MNWFMLSCKKATELIEKQSLVGLVRKEKVLLRLHTSMCNGCTAYQKQSILIDKFLHQHLGRVTEETVPYLENKELKDRIITKF
jgi:hypothetical protein